jgi:hypothetical protein
MKLNYGPYEHDTEPTQFRAAPKHTERINWWTIKGSVIGIGEMTDLRIKATAKPGDNPGDWNVELAVSKDVAGALVGFETMQQIVGLAVCRAIRAAADKGNQRV